MVMAVGTPLGDEYDVSTDLMTGVTTSEPANVPFEDSDSAPKSRQRIREIESLRTEIPVRFFMLRSVRQKTAGRYYPNGVDHLTVIPCRKAL
jgi:hypothetical protein